MYSLLYHSSPLTYGEIFPADIFDSVKAEDMVNNYGYLFIVWFNACTQREGRSAWVLVSDPKWKA